MITIPATDSALFRRLPKSVQSDVQLWLPIVNEVIARKPGVCAAIRAAAESCGKPFATVRRRYYAAKKHGWRGLADGRCKLTRRDTV